MNPEVEVEVEVEFMVADGDKSNTDYIPSSWLNR